jgi:hypothetical protein
MANCLALTVFSSSDGHETRKKVKTGKEAPRAQHGQNFHSFSVHEGGSCEVKTTETIRIAPIVKLIVFGKLELPKRRESPELVCVEPAQLPFEGVLAVRGLDRVVARPLETNPQRTRSTMTSHKSAEIRAYTRPSACHDSELQS